MSRLLGVEAKSFNEEAKPITDNLISNVRKKILIEEGEVDKISDE